MRIREHMLCSYYIAPSLFVDERMWVCSGAYFAFCAAPPVMTAMQRHNSVVVQRSVASYTNCTINVHSITVTHTNTHACEQWSINARQRVVT